MLRYVTRRSLNGLLVMVLVTVTVFFVSRILTDPAKRALGVNATPERIEEFRQALGLSDPLWEQFVRFLKDMVTLNFGRSLWTREPSLELVLHYIPATLQLVFASLVLAIVVFVPLGVAAGLRPGSRLDKTLVGVSLLGVSIPAFWLAAVFIIIFAVRLGWLPTSGRGTWQHLVLPAVTLAIGIGGRLAQIVRDSVIAQMGATYVLTARARGFSTGYILRHHVFRNASVPILALVAFEFSAALAGGAVLVETIYAWPGIGRLAVQASKEQDIILVQAVVFFSALVIVCTNIVADVCFKLVDPRIEL